MFVWLPDKLAKQNRLELGLLSKETTTCIVTCSLFMSLNSKWNKSLSGEGKKRVINFSFTSMLKAMVYKEAYIHLVYRKQNTCNTVTSSNIFLKRFFMNYSQRLTMILYLCDDAHKSSFQMYDSCLHLRGLYLWITSSSFDPGFHSPIL